MKIRDIILLTLCTFIIAVSVARSVDVYLTKKQLLIEAVDEKLFTAATLLGAVLGEGYHDKITDKNSISDEEFRKIVARNDGLCRKLGLQYLWSNMIIDGKIVFTSSTSPDKDVNNKKYAPFFDTHKDPHAFDKVFQTMKTGYSYFRNEWGSGRMVLIPEVDINGRRYCLGASVNTDEIAAALRGITFRALSVVSITTLLGMLISIPLAGYLSKPIENLTAATMNIAKGNLRKPVSIKGAYEIEALGKSIDSMRVSISDKIKEIVKRSSEAELYRKLSEFAEDGVYRYALDDGRILFANQGFVSILGLDCAPDDVVGKLMKDILIYTEEPGTIRRKLIEKDEIRDFEYHFKTLKGDDKWVLHNSLIHTEEATGKRVIEAVVKDITAKKNAEEALRESEARLHFALESINTGAWELDLVDQTAFRSIEHDRIFGYAELLPKWTFEMFMEHVLPEDRETVSRKFRHAIENKTDWDFECRIQQINGPVRWIWSRGRHVFDASGRAFKMAGIVQDITDRKNAEEALRESEKRFRTIFEEAPMGVALIDSLTGHIYEVNSRFAEIAGWTRAEMATIDWMSITHPDDVQEDLDNMALLNAGKISGFHMNKRYRRPDGSYVWISMTIAPITVRDKSQPRHLCMIEDITDRRKAEEELRRHRDHLEEMVKERTKNLEAVNKELSAFSYSVAHDIRAPLRSIDGFSKALLEDCAESLNEESRSYLGRIRTSSQLMAQLLDDVLNLAHVSQADLTRRDVDLSKIARSIAAEIKEAEPSRDTEFVIEPDIVVNGDATLLSLVMKNLLDNAWKFTAKTMHAKIEFAREQKDGKRIYFVRDNGVGFDAAYVDKLFNPFQRLHSKTEFHGTGIGLSIVKRIIHRHGGYVWAEGSVGQGATFYFTV